MTSEGELSRKGLIKGICWFAGLLLLAGLIGFWISSLKDKPGNRFRPAANVTLEEFSRLKKVKQIHEAWLDRDDLYARMEPGGYVRDSKVYPFIYVTVPPRYLDSSGILELRSGLDPARFTVLRPYP